jgi:hypothetical protein
MRITPESPPTSEEEIAWDRLRINRISLPFPKLRLQVPEFLWREFEDEVLGKPVAIAPKLLGY